MQQRRNSFEDGVLGTTSPIPSGRNFTYILQVKDQIDSFYYFPSLTFHKAAGGFEGIRILSRPRIPVSFPDPAGDYTLLVGDWYTSNHTTLKEHLDGDKKLPFLDGILINGRGPNGASFNVEQGKTYRLRISNVGLENPLNFGIQNHKMKLVEVEGTHTLQTTYSSLDVHVGQSYSILITADQLVQDYYFVVSSAISSEFLTSLLAICAPDELLPSRCLSKFLDLKLDNTKNETQCRKRRHEGGYQVSLLCFLACMQGYVSKLSEKCLNPGHPLGALHADVTTMEKLEQKRIEELNCHKTQEWEAKTPIPSSIIT